MTGNAESGRRPWSRVQHAQVQRIVAAFMRGDYAVAPPPRRPTRHNPAGTP